MGVDWYSCRNCGDTFPDCGDFVSCECGEHWCDYDCAEALLEFALKLLNKNRQELIKDYKNNKE